MNTIYRDLVIVGGGPAGIAAAVEASKQGVEKITIIERDVELGGILQQCIHDGFGLITFKETLTGGQYAQRFIDMLKDRKVELMLDTMVLDITEDKRVYATNERDGFMEIEARAVILAMGCRERSRSQVFIAGTRPAGVYTAGTVQRYINMEGYLPGRKAVILGSGDIGLIMARRMHLEGIDVEGVYEIMQSEGGLTRNIVQCLEDYEIPLHLATTVTKIHGKQRVEGVTISEVDENLKPIAGTERYIECDLVVLSVGLIPENELSLKAKIDIHPVTKGPIVDDNMMTSVEGIFAAGNVVAVFDLVDFVSQTGEIAAKGAARYIEDKLNLEEEYTELVPGDNLSFVLPQRIRKSGIDDRMPIFMRVRSSDEKTRLYASLGEEEIQTGRFSVVKPPEMVHASLRKDVILDSSDKIHFHMKREG